MATIYRKSEISGIPEGANIDNSFWNYFLLLEKDFENSLRYVFLDKSNFSTFSLEFVKQIICIATEFETIIKLLCNEIDGSSPGNMKEYKEIILKRFPKIWSTPVYVDSHTQLQIFPLEIWKSEKGRLEWWDVYGGIKHTRHMHFNNATLGNTLHALGSLLIVEVYLYRIAFPSPKNFRFGSNLFRTPGLAEITYMSKKTELPDFEI